MLGTTKSRVTVARLLCGFAGQRHEARDGMSHVSPEDRGHCLDTLEKGGTFRRRRTEDASRLSVAQNSRGSQVFMPARGHRFYGARVRGRVSIQSLDVRVLSCSTESP